MGGTAFEEAARRYRAAVSLMADAASVEVTRTLAGHGVRTVVLKGPALAEWLYRDGGERSYGDTDLLVAPENLDVARTVLAELGFAVQAEQLPPPGETVHAEPFFRAADGAAVDLHRTLFGCGVPPQRVWPVVSADTVPLRLAGEELEAPSLDVRALVVVLHGAQHGPEAGKPLEDLRRALELGDDDLWARAADLAVRLHAELPFATGLALVPGGRELGRRLGLIDPTVASEALSGSGPFVLGLDRVMAARGGRAKLTLLARELVPPADEMRWQEQSEGRGDRLLALAYAQRLGRLARHAPASIRAIRRSYAAGAGRGAAPRSNSGGG